MPAVVPHAEPAGKQRFPTSSNSSSQRSGRIKWPVQAERLSPLLGARFGTGIFINAAPRTRGKVAGESIWWFSRAFPHPLWLAEIWEE